MTPQRPFTGDEIRAAFLRFYEERGHLVMPSASLIPAGDPTLLLTSAGMVPFKPYYAGDEEPPSRRLASCQKCFRTTDIDEVGDRTHHTMFEMLGNFSIGDYFKHETIHWAWEFVTEVLGLDASRLWPTVHHSDDEAYAIWRDEVGVPEERITRCGDKDNFWGPAGDEGACGPSSEVHYDFGAHLAPDATPCSNENGRFVEICNLVFPQFYQAKDGTRTPLPAPGIDTGMGLERVTAIIQGKPSAYETDLLAPVVRTVERVSGKRYGADEETDFAMRVVVEHGRSATFLIADGVVPGNEARGYVLRRVIRRGIRFARKLGVGGPFLAQVSEAVIERMGKQYPELVEHRKFVLRSLEMEEERFSSTYERGSAILKGINQYHQRHGGALKELIEFAKAQNPGAENAVAVLEQYGFSGYDLAAAPDERMGQELAAEGISSLAYRLFDAIENQDQDRIVHFSSEIEKWPGTNTAHEAFVLYDSFGFPIDLTREIAQDHGLSVDVAGFEQEMEAQRERARQAARFGGGRDVHRTYGVLGVGETEFLGYDTLEADTVVVGMLKDGQPVQRAEAGDEVEVVLRETSFYPEGGGQVGDTGTVKGAGGMAEVTDTQKPVGDIIVHYAQVTQGSLAVGENVRAIVDEDRRSDIMRNHTATHLLHAVLREVLGSHARQAGSLVAPDRLRFDFTHVAALTREELDRIERTVNDRIRGDLALVKREETHREAIARGALAFFGERYGDTVRTIQIGEERPVSFELCGGTHLDRTGQIGLFHIVGETSVGTGVRRIEAVTGRGAEDWVKQRLGWLDAVSARLQATPAEAASRIDALLQQVEEARRASNVSQREASRQEAQALLEKAQRLNGITVLAARSNAPDMDTLREMGDWLRDKLGSAIVVLGGVFNERPSVIAMVTQDLVDKGYSAGDIVRVAAKRMGGSGGGRPHLAQGGGKEPAQLDDALEAAVAAVREKGA